MKKNMAVLDRLLRLVIAIVLLVLFFTRGFASPWNYVLPAIAVIFILSALAGSCPLYSVFGIDTRQFKEADGFKRSH